MSLPGAPKVSQRLRQENRARGFLGQRRQRLTDDQRRRIAAKGIERRRRLLLSQAVVTTGTGLRPAPSRLTPILQGQPQQ